MRTLDNIIEEAKTAHEANDKAKLKAVLTELDRLPNGITQAIMAELRMSPMFISNIIDDDEVEEPQEPVRSNVTGLTLNEISGKINSLKEDNNKGTVEIGRLLAIAHEEVPYGSWGKWVNKNVSFTRQHTNTLITTSRIVDDGLVKHALQLRPELLHSVVQFSTCPTAVNELISAVMEKEKDDADVSVSTIRELQSVLVGVHVLDKESLTEIITLLSNSRTRKDIGNELKVIKQRSDSSSSNDLINAYSEYLLEDECVEDDDDYDVLDDEDPNIQSVADFFDSTPSTSTVVDFPSPPFTLSDERYESIIQGVDDMAVKDHDLISTPQLSYDERKALKRKSFASNTRCAAEALWECLETTTVDELVESIAKEEINFARLDTYIEKLTRILGKLADKNEKQKYEVI